MSKVLVSEQIVTIPTYRASAPEKKAETAEPLPAPEYPADYTPPVKNKPQSREWC